MPFLLPDFLEGVACATCTSSDPHRCPHRQNIKQLVNALDVYYFDLQNGVIAQAPRCRDVQVNQIGDGGGTVYFPVCIRGIGTYPQEQSVLE